MKERGRVVIQTEIGYPWWVWVRERSRLQRWRCSLPESKQDNISQNGLLRVPLHTFAPYAVCSALFPGKIFVTPDNR